MRRKVIRQGHNTLTVTLPRKWAGRLGIKSGDELEVEERERSLAISQEKLPELSSIRIDLNDLSSELIWRTICSAYRAGYDEIIVKGIRHTEKEIYSALTYNTLDCLRHQDILALSPLETVQSITNRLIGMEVIEQKEDYCILKELSETTGKEFDNALRRIFLILKNESEIILDSLKGKKEPLKSIHLLDTNLDRFGDFCFRVLNKRGYTAYRKTPVIYSFIFFLELIGDQFKKIVIHLLTHPEKVSPPLKQLFQIEHQQLDRLYALFYQFDHFRLEEIISEHKKIIESTEKDYINKLEMDELEILYHLRKINSHIQSLIELKLNLEY